MMQGVDKKAVGNPIVQTTIHASLFFAKFVSCKARGALFRLVNWLPAKNNAGIQTFGFIFSNVCCLKKKDRRIYRTGQPVSCILFKK